MRITATQAVEAIETVSATTSGLLQFVAATQAAEAIETLRLFLPPSFFMAAATQAAEAIETTINRESAHCRVSRSDADRRGH